MGEFFSSKGKTEEASSFIKGWDFYSASSVHPQETGVPPGRAVHAAGLYDLEWVKLPGNAEQMGSKLRGCFMGSIGDEP